MSRLFHLFLLCLLVASCGVRGSTTAPRQLDDACAILDQRPSFLPAFKAAERKYQVPVAVLMAMIYQESKFISNARTPMKYALGVIPMGRQSSAFGYSQALDGTWDEYRDRAGRWGARRDNIRDATDFMGWYMSLTQEELGIPMNDTRRQYLAYHEGRTGYARGSFRAKRWLRDVAAKLEDRAIMYHIQLERCGAI